MQDPTNFWLGRHVVVHCVHAVAPSDELYLPVSEPELQLEHVTVPSPEANFPITHGVHAVTAEFLENFPISH